MSLELTRPMCLLGLLLLAAVVYFHRRSLVDFARRQRWVSVILRAIILTLIVLALAGLTLLQSTRRQFVVFAVDQSLSVSEEGAKQAEELIEKARQAQGGNGMAVVRFPTDANEKVSDLAGAIELAAASIPPSYVPHVVLVSDGNETRGDAVAAVKALGLRVSTSALKTRDDPEAQVTQVDAPPRVREGEPFHLDILIDANREGDATVDVYRGPHKAATQKVKLVKGENRLRMRQSMEHQKVSEFTVRLSGAADTLLDNNQASALVFAEGKPRVLMIESEPKTARHLARALKEQEILLDVRPPEGMPAQLADLQNYELLILSNVPATSLSLAQMEAARAWVSDLGGGLIMIGGDQSFGLGGYYKTVIEQILPVRSDFEKEKQKPSLAMMIVIDKSGSMGGMKIELAKDAARSAVELLGPKDSVGVLAFDGNTYEVCPLHPASDRNYVIDRIATITAGGGTTMGPAMQQALDTLTGATAKLKHAIILTDGISSPADFEAIAGNMAAARITASTVAVGEGAHQSLLQRIAQIGGGRSYFTNDPTSIPQIFAKETMTASKSAIQEEPFQPQVLRRAAALAEIDLSSAPFLLGYVSTRPKPTSEVILGTERGEPLLAWWRYGLGMTAAFTSDAKSRWAAEWVNWPAFSRFWAQVVRHVMRKSDAAGVTVDMARKDGKATLTLDAADVDGRYRNDAVLEVTVLRPHLTRQTLSLSQTAPGRYEATFEADAQGAYHLEVTDKTEGDAKAVQSRGMVVGYPAELRIAPTNDVLLQAIAKAGDGLVNPTAQAVFAPTDRTARRTTPLWPWLIAAAILLFIADVALRRIDLSVVWPGIVTRGKSPAAYNKTLRQGAA